MRELVARAVLASLEDLGAYRTLDRVGWLRAVGHVGMGWGPANTAAERAVLHRKGVDGHV